MDIPDRIRPDVLRRLHQISQLFCKDKTQRCKDNGNH